MKWTPSGHLLVGFDVVDEVIHGVNALLHSEVELVVQGAQLLSHLACRQQVWGPLYADRERVQGVLAVIGVLGLLQVSAAGS